MGLVESGKCSSNIALKEPLLSKYAVDYCVNPRRKRISFHYLKMPIIVANMLSISIVLQELNYLCGLYKVTSIYRNIYF